MAFDKDKTTERDIVIQVVQDLSKLSQKEFRGGYNNKAYVGNNIIETYTPDSRREYIQLVDFLSDLLLPRFDEATREVYEEIQDSIQKLVEKTNNNENTKKEYEISMEHLTKKLKDNEISKEDFLDELREIIKTKEDHEMSDEDFIVEKLRLSRRLFQHLSILLNKLNWLRAKGVSG